MQTIPEMSDFIMSLNIVIGKIQKYTDAQLDTFPSMLWDELEGKLDEPLIKMIDRTFGEMQKIGSSRISEIIKVLDENNQRFGTEPRAAICAAEGYLQTLLRKM